MNSSLKRRTGNFGNKLSFIVASDSCHKLILLESLNTSLTFHENAAPLRPHAVPLRPHFLKFMLQKNKDIFQ